MVKHLIKAAVGAALVAGIAAAPASAVTILTFTQVGTSYTVAATNPDATHTTISGSNIAVTLNSDSGTQSGYLTFSTTSTGAVVQTGSGSMATYQQAFGSGVFTITTLAGGLGTNILSGSFDAMTFGWLQTANIGASTPAQDVTFTSSVFSGLSDPLALSWSLNTDRPLSNSNGTLGAFSASISGNFSATVPEPASWAMMVAGFGMLGATMRRRKTTTAVSFG